jgi:hypothetical protein
MQRLIVKDKSNSTEFHSEAYNGEDNVSDEAKDLLAFEDVYCSEIVDDKQEEACDLAEQISQYVKDSLKFGIYGGKHWAENLLTQDPKVNVWDVVEEHLEFKYDIDFRWNDGLPMTVISIRQRSIPGSSFHYELSDLNDFFANPETGDPSITLFQGGGPDPKNRYAPTIAVIGHYKGHKFNLDIYLTDEDKYFDGTVKFKKEEW